MSKEAMKLALEALEEAKTSDDSMEKWDRNKRAITALREALAEQPAQQEPVAWMYEDMMGLVGVRVQKEKPIVARPITPLYTSPPAQRTWVGLSPADRGKCLSAGDAHGWIGVMEATEARLKELNT